MKSEKQRIHLEKLRVLHLGSVSPLRGKKDPHSQKNGGVTCLKQERVKILEE